MKKQVSKKWSTIGSHGDADFLPICLSSQLYIGVINWEVQDFISYCFDFCFNFNKLPRISDDRYEAVYNKKTKDERIKFFS